MTDWLRAQRPFTQICLTLCAVIIIGYGTALFTGMKSFHLWPQVVDLICNFDEHLAKRLSRCHAIETGALPEPEALRKSTAEAIPALTDLNQNADEATSQTNNSRHASIDFYHPHFLRYLVIAPSVIIASHFDLNVHHVFSLLCFALLVTTAWISARIVLRLLPSIGIAPSALHTALVMLGALSVWFAISLFMNGRLLHAFLGICLLLLGQLRQLQDRRPFDLSALLMQALGVFLCTVSAGTLTVAVLDVALFQLVMLLLPCNQQRSYSARGILVLLILTAGILPNLLQMVAKNLTYFKFYFGKMLLHGPFNLLHQMGVAIEHLPFLLAVYCASMLLISLWVCRWLYRHFTAALPLALLAIPALTVGMTGYSTLLTILPVCVILALGVSAYVAHHATHRHTMAA